MRRTAALLVLVLGVSVLGPATSSDAAPLGPSLPRPEADYRFNNDLTSAVPGAPVLRNLIDNGPSVFANMTVDGRSDNVLVFPQGNGLRLGNVTTLVARNKYTIAVKSRFDDVGDDYARLIAFKPDSNDYADTGLYVELQDLVWFDRRRPDLDNIGAGQWVTVTLSRSANGVVRAYVGPDQVFSFNDANSRAVIDANRIIRFFRDNDNNEESGGAVTRIRIWDEVLTADQVARLSAV